MGPQLRPGRTTVSLSSLWIKDSTCASRPFCKKDVVMEGVNAIYRLSCIVQNSSKADKKWHGLGRHWGSIAVHPALYSGGKLNSKDDQVVFVLSSRMKQRKLHQMPCNNREQSSPASYVQSPFLSRRASARQSRHSRSCYSTPIPRLFVHTRVSSGL